MPPKLPIPPKEELRCLYEDQFLTAKAIAAHYNVCRSTVTNWLIHHSIPRRVSGTKIPIPPERTLRILYLDYKLTTTAIGEQLGVSSTTVSNWLIARDIPRRPAGTGLQTRGKQPPSPEELYRLVHVEHKTYEVIAAMYGVDFTAVPYWLDKYDIPHPKLGHSRWNKDPPTPCELRELYESGLALHHIGAIYGVAHPTIANLCRDYGIPVRPSGFDGARKLECDDGHLVRSVYELRTDNWLHQYNIDHVYEPTLPFGANFKADFLANRWYIEIWGVTGSTTYEERKARKIRQYRVHNLPLISLPGYAFAPDRDGLWKRKLQVCRHPAAVQLSLPSIWNN